MILSLVSRQPTRFEGGFDHALAQLVQNRPVQVFKDHELLEFDRIDLKLEILPEKAGQSGQENLQVQIHDAELVLVQGHFGLLVDVVGQLVFVLDLLEHGESRGELDVLADGVRDHGVDVTQNEVEPHDSDHHRKNCNHSLQGCAKINIHKGLTERSFPRNPR